jgi:hypothetical protein
MLFESILTILALGIGVFFVGIPGYKIVKSLLPHKADPLADAQERLEIARKEVEAARLNKEAEKLYGKMYEEVLADDDDTSNEANKTNRR